DYKINSNDLLEGLFKSSVLLKAARHIFVSPSLAQEDGSWSTQAGNAAFNGMTRITPASIAYVVTSSETVFGRKIKGSQFNLYAFYDNILVPLGQPDMVERTRLILDYWTDNVLGGNPDAVFDDEDGGTASAILAQLCAA
ncbi:hypothetical protein FRC05_004263, partial [Tulasnella sp. 425]